MNAHSEFFEFLSGRPSGKEIQDAYRSYKTAEKNCAFELNGRLKAGLPLDSLLPLLKHLMLAICARNREELVLYRMTSDTEFMGPLLPAINRQPIRYPAFLSASGRADRIQKFVPQFGVPLVLEITCPPGTYMALLEAPPGAEEDEYLLGCGTQFSVTTPSQAVVRDKVPLYVGPGSSQKQVNYLQLRVDTNPEYTARNGAFDF